MFRLSAVDVDGVCRWYLFKGAGMAVGPFEEVVLEGKRSTRRKFLLCRSSGQLIKIKRDKYRPSRHFFRWLGRVVSERVFARSEARLEYLGNKIYDDAGLNPIPAVGWGIALNPFNPYGSIYVMRHLGNATTARRLLVSGTNDHRDAVLNRLCQCVTGLARMGYYNRDLHLGNLLVDKDSTSMFWIDTHVHRLPRKVTLRRTVVMESVLRKLDTPENVSIVRQMLESAL